MHKKNINIFGPYYKFTYQTVHVPVIGANTIGPQNARNISEQRMNIYS